MKPMAMRLSSLSRIERQTLACVRSLRFPAEAPVCRSDFQICNAVRLMADQLAGTQLSIWHPGSMFLSQDETLLLTSLAAMQRRSGVTLHSALNSDLIETLQKCAAALTEVSVRLPVKASINLDIVAAPERHPMETPRYNACQQSSGSCVRDRSVGAIVLAMVRERGLVSTREFEAAGVSRQYLSLLCKKGSLRRFRHGWYAPCGERPTTTIGGKPGKAAVAGSPLAHIASPRKL